MHVRSLAVVLSLSLGAVAHADEAPPDDLPRVRVTVHSVGEPLDVGVERADERGARFERVCQTPCAISVPARSAQLARLQVRAPASPGAALQLDALALDGARLTVQPPRRTAIRAGAALLAVGIVTTAVGGVLMPYGREIATRADVDPVAGIPGGAVTFGAGVASTIAGALLLATSRPRVRRVERVGDAPVAAGSTLTGSVTALTIPGRWPNGS